MQDSDDQPCRKLLAESELNTPGALLRFKAIEQWPREAVQAGEGAYVQDVAGTAAWKCLTCGEFKPRADFEYFLTGRQALIRGYAQNVKVKAEGVNQCRACRPKRKSVRELTRRELHNRVELGEMHQMIGEAYHARLDRLAPIKKTQAVSERWRAQMTLMWSPITDNLTLEQQAVTQAKKYLKHPGPRAVPVADDDMAARVAFYDAYYDALRALKARIKLRYIANDDTKIWPPRPDGGKARVLTERQFAEAPPCMGLDICHWVDLMHTREWVGLMGLWHAIPEATRAKIRAPALLRRHAALAPDDE
jgi:hypothetical protein